MPPILGSGSASTLSVAAGGRCGCAPTASAPLEHLGVDRRRRPRAGRAGAQHRDQVVDREVRPSRAASAGSSSRCAASARRSAPSAGPGAGPARSRTRRGRRQRSCPSRSAAASAASSTTPPRADVGQRGGRLHATQFGRADVGGATPGCTARRRRRGRRSRAARPCRRSAPAPRPRRLRISRERL